jgi:hypothetical protein
MASVRVVNVGGKEYLQVVEYYRRADGRQSLRVLKSFGQYTVENWLKASQFAASYDQLRAIGARAAENSVDWDELLKGALTVFGVILGAGVVAAVLGEIFGED